MVGLQLDNHKKIFEENLEQLRKMSGYSSRVILKPGKEYIRLDGFGPDIPKLVGMGLSIERARVVRGLMQQADMREVFLVLVIDGGCFSLFMAKQKAWTDLDKAYYVLADTTTDH